jgi:hypothetical protein
MTTAVTTSRAVAVATPTALRGQRVAAAVLALPERCYRCGTITTSIIGFLVPSHYMEDPDGFVDFELLASLFARRVTAAQLARCGVGPIKMRRSRYRPESYLSNGCIGCDAIQGWFPLHEHLMEFLSEGGTHDELTIGRWQLRESELRGCLAVEEH